MQTTFKQFKGFRWALPLAIVTLIAVGCGSSETPAEEPAATEVAAPAEPAAPDTTTQTTDTTNMPIDTNASGKPPVNRK